LTRKKKTIKRVEIKLDRKKRRVKLFKKIVLKIILDKSLLRQKQIAIKK
jgi:hypothetical protein